MSTLRTALAATAITLAIAAPAHAIVGGQAVKPGAYPYTVRLVSNGNTVLEGGYCGGTLIAPNVVLTAAHCALETITGAKGRHYMQPEDINVLVGSEFLGASELVKSTRIIVHPKFDKPRMRYDVALVILDHDVSTKFIPMASVSPRAGSSVSATGWGAMDEWGVGHPVHLRAASLKVRTLTDCRHGNAPLGNGVTFYAPTMLCANAPGRDTCIFDSGGPLVGYVSGHLALVGITSYGTGCAEYEHPGVYTRVSAIRSWALAQLGQ